MHLRPASPVRNDKERDRKAVGEQIGDDAAGAKGCAGENVCGVCGMGVERQTAVVKKTAGFIEIDCLLAS